MRRIFLNEDELFTIKRICSETLRGFGARVYLFGSRATGKNPTKADVDLFVDLKGAFLSEDELRKLQRELSSRLEWELEVWVDVVVWTGENKFPEDFLEEVRETGVLVWEG